MGSSHEGDEGRAVVLPRGVLAPSELPQCGSLLSGEAGLAGSGQ